MTRRIAIQMDPIQSINPKTDSSLAIGLEAQKRGYEVFYYTPDTLACLDGRVTAHAYPVKLYDDLKHWYELGEKTRLDLEAVDAVFLRQDPPFNMTYITTTYLLERIHPRTLVVNNPAAVRNHPEKLFPFVFREFMPPTLVTADIEEISLFRTEYKDIVVKPLYGHGGRGVFRLRPEDSNLMSLTEMMFSTNREPVMVQAFLPEVKNEDKRIILIDGKFAGAMKRIPADNEIRANLRAGGTAVPTELTGRQREICDAMEATLQKEGLLFVGLDVIGDYLTEINLTSPTGIRDINRFDGGCIEAVLWDAIEKRL